MSMKMSVAAVEMFDVKDNSMYSVAAEKPKFRVVTTNDLTNPFTFDDERVLKHQALTSKQRNQLVAFILGVLITFALTVCIQSTIHTSKVEELIASAPIEQVVVMPGDTLWNLASQNCHGKMSVSEFVHYVSQINNLSDASLTSGQVLNIPSL